MVKISSNVDRTIYLGKRYGSLTFRLIETVLQVKHGEEDVIHGQDGGDIEVIYTIRGI